MDKLIKLIIAISFLLIGVSVFYYLLFFIPNSEKAKERIKEAEKQEIKNCLPASLKRVEEINGDREDANYYFKKCLREKGLTKE